jgi:tetratricopeptide (TPR) repeat protein
LLAEALTGQRLDEADVVRSLRAGLDRASWQRLRRAFPDECAFPSPEKMLAWHRLESYLAEQRKDWFAARWHLDRLIAGNPRLGILYARRLQAHAELDDLDSADADCRKAIERKVNTRTLWYHHALLRLRAGDAAGYRRACARIRRVNRSAGEDRPDHSGVPTCALGPSSGADLTAVLNEIEHRIRSKGRWTHREYGAVLYRADRFREALEHLAKGDAPQDQFLLAMTYHRRDQTTEARRCLDRGRELIAASPPRQLSWNVRLELYLLQREAEALLKRSKK